MFEVPIIPLQPTFSGVEGTLDHEAICVFSAIGFFLDQDTYYHELKTLKPGHHYVDPANWSTGVPWFEWHYEPRDITFSRAVDEFSDLFERIVNEQTGNRKVILPLSGGLDSRTQAAALAHLGKEVHAYGYQFEDGIDETHYSSKVARTVGFPFERWIVPRGYLWESIDQLAALNGCYSEFTHPRQMAFIDRYALLGDVFSVGHWGDVLFNDMGVPEGLTLEEQTLAVEKKIVKRGGMELAQALWQHWSLPGEFADYLRQRLRSLVAKINITNSANARIRAFKSLYWATRWTATNLSVYRAVRPVTAPYFDDRMCRFICSVPEKWLAARKIQIEYIKRRSPALARVPWQEHRPFNLYTYRWNRMPFQLPYVAWWKIRNSLRSRKLIERNWELQFLGEENDKHLRYYLFDDLDSSKWISNSLKKSIYESFSYIDPTHFSHSVSLLLTLSMFTRIVSNTSNHNY